MEPSPAGPLLRHLRKLIDPAHSPGVTDAELLERFVRRRDEAAFELLRHGHLALMRSFPDGSPPGRGYDANGCS
jgi:hypothetical protein